MRKNLKEQAEKSLKSFLKKKKIGYTAALLTAYLITGGIGLATSSGLETLATQSQETLIDNIEAQKSEILLLLEENERKLKELKNDQYELVRKGNFYSKPIYESEMVLFPIVIEHNGKMKNKTKSEFKISYDATNRYYQSQGYNMNASGEEAGKKPLVGLTSEEAKGLTYEQQIALLLEKNNGVLAKENTPDVITVDLGANIQLITPQIPQLSVSPQVETPSVNMPQLPTPQIVQVTPPSAPTAPIVTTVTVSAPSDVDQINIAEPILVDPNQPQERDITVATPTSPDIFDPLMIIPPEAPSIPVVNIPTLPTIEINVVSNGNGYEVYVDNPSGNNSVISHVGILGGDFKVSRDDAGTIGSGNYWDNYWGYSYDNYDVINIGNTGATGDILLNVNGVLTGLSTGGAIKNSMTGQRGFLRQLESYPTYNNGNFIVSRAIEDPLTETDEFVHMDMHGGTTKSNVRSKLETASNLTGKNIETLAAWDDIVDNLDTYKTEDIYSVFSNSGKITLEGGNLSLNNQYDHIGYGKNIAINTGRIRLQPYNDGTNQYGGNNAVFVVSRDLSGSPHDIMYNGSTGIIDIYTKNSVGYIIDSGYNYSWTHGYIYKYDYSNYQWSSWQLNPMGGNPSAYDISGSNTYYQGKDQMINDYIRSYNPYSSSGSGPTYSTVNRGEINIYGAGSAGVYLKSIGQSNNSISYSKDDRGGLTTTFDFVGVDCSVNGGVADWVTYPDYGFPIVDSPYQYQHTYIPDGWPSDLSTTNFGGGTADIQFVKEDGTPAPIAMYGDQSVGLYVPGDSSGSQTKTIDVYEQDMATGTTTHIETMTVEVNGIGKVTGNVYVDLGDSNGTGNVTYTSDPSETSGTQITNDPLGNTNLTTIDGAAAILSGADLDLTSHGIRIFDGNKGSLGVGIINGSTHRLGTGYINILGGIDNVGVFIDEGNLISQGEINILGGTGSVGILQSSGIAAEAQVKTINVGHTDNSTIGGVGIFAINSGTELTASGRINVYGDNYGTYATNSGKAILSKSTLNGTKDNPDMYVKGSTSASGQPTGVGLIVSRGTSGGIIEARNYYLKTENNSAGVASSGLGSLIDMQGSVIDYAGRGYAVYSDGVGQVNLENGGEIKLRSGTALELNMSLGTSPVLFDITSKITMLSNDAIAVNLTNLPGAGLSISTLYTDITGYLGNVGIVDGTENGVTYDKYKVAAVDGGTLTIDTALDKSDSNPASASYFYYRRFLGQRMNVNVQRNVSAVINSQTATDYYRGTVAGLEMSSSAKASGRSDTSINIQNGVTVTADRTDSGTGAIGAYINFGDLTNSGEVSVETGSNTVNNGGIGIYGVNGAVLTNQNKIEVSGNKAVGMYGIAYRVDSDGVIVAMEFGSTLTDQGNTLLSNNGTIKINGSESVGMYGLNNSEDPSLPIGTPTKTVTVTNTGTIDVSTGKDSIGMYGVGNTNISNGGTIKVGETGIGIYGGTDSTITSIGTINLGKDGIGIVLNGNANITAASYTPIGSYVGGKGKVGLLLKSETDGVIDTTAKTLNININASGLDHGTALYIKDRTNVTSQGNIDVGNTGVGIYLNNGNGINTGTIGLGTSSSAIGMYATKGKLTNAGTININTNGQIGMVAYGTGGEVENTGLINLSANNSTAIYVKDGAVFSLNGTGVINFAGTKNFGVFAEKGIVNIGTSVNVNLANADENIYIYGKDGSTINHTSGTFAINGGGASGNKKTIGVYLNNNTNSTNRYLSTGGTITVTGGALGVYSKNMNNITLNQVDVTGDKSVGIYMENGGKLSGKVTSSGATATESVVGVYGNGGTINIDNPLTLEMGAGNTYGLGMYLENGVSVEGQGITIDNKNTANTNVGLYYTGNSTSVHGTDITILGNKIVGLYADNGIKLSSSKDIKFATGATEQVGAYVLGNSEFTNTGMLDVLSNNSTAIYVGKGIGTNTGTIEVTGSNSGGLIAQGKSAGDVAKVLNQGTIDVSSGVGILLGDTSSSGVLGTSVGENKGTINAKAGTVGVSLSGNDDARFDGTNGTISITGASGNSSTGIMLLGTTSGQVANAGTLQLNNGDAIGIYGKDSDIDFDVRIDGQQGGTGVFVESTTGGTVSGKIDASGSSGTVALYVKNAFTTIAGAVVTTGRSILSGATGVGIYFGDNYTLTNTTVNTTGDGVGIVSASGKTLNYSSGATTNVGTGGTGIYIGGTGSILDTTGGVINIDGAGTGISVGSGAVANVGVLGNLSINFTGTGGVAIVSEAGATVNIGSGLNTTGNGTLSATVDGNLVNTGTLNLTGGSVGLQGSFTTGGSLINSASGVIIVTNGSIGMSASGTGSVLVENNGYIEVDGLGSVGMATDVGTISNSSTGTMKVKNSGLGIYAKGNSTITTLGTIDVYGGIAFVSDGTSSTPTGVINLHDGSTGNYSIGGYFIDIGTLPNTYTVNQIGNYSIGNVVKGTGSTIVNHLNQVGGTGTAEQIALMAEGQSGSKLGLTINAPIVVLDGGRNNIGVFGSNTDINMGSSSITVGASESSSDLSKSSIGAYVSGGSLTTSGSLSVGENSFGIVGKSVSNISTGSVSIGDKSIGIYGEGDGSVGKITSSSLITGNNNSIGIYGKEIGSKVTGGVTVGNTSSIGIINEGSGDIEVDGSIQISGVSNIDSGEGSIGIYKNGTNGNVKIGQTSSTIMNIGREGYGLYVEGGVKGAGGTIVVDNASSMNLSTSAVGIYANGDVLVKNTGSIVVGDTYLGVEGNHEKTEQHRNSVGIYVSNGAVLQSSGNIDVFYDHSVGIYGKGKGTTVTLTGGTLTVDNGGVGILVKEGAIATVGSGAQVIVNETVSPSCDGNSIGIAAYAGSSIINNGSITVNNGVGIYVTAGASFTNNGVINLNNGVGIGGAGTYIAGSGGIVNINGGTLQGSASTSDTTKGSVTISNDGKVVINGNYITTGGILDAGDTSIMLDGAYVAIEALTDAKVPLFTAEIVEGNIKLLPDFATAGNGYEWTITNFNTALGAAVSASGTSSKVTVETSPLFVKKEITTATGDQALRIVKVPYKDLVVEDQFESLYDGLENLLYNGEKGADRLKEFNAYLEGVHNTGGTDSFNSELTRGMAELRGDLYATSQRRMQDVQRAVDGSWEELEKQYNISKDSDKYSVIYRYGKYKDDTVGLDDYEHTTYGLLYMKEYEGRNYLDKHGFTLGFAVSKFKFDDNGMYDNKSKEDIYSVRVGAHKVKSLLNSDGEDRTRLVSRIELGYNRHEAKRVIELDKATTSKGNYNSYQITFDNKIEHVLTRGYNHKLGIYGAINMEYGRLTGFSEKSGQGLELKIKSNDYFSIQPELGLEGHVRKHIGKGLSAKLEGKVAYSYELGTNYDRNKAKIKDGSTGYYELVRPDKEEGVLKGKVGLTFEKSDKVGVTFEVEARKHDNKKEADLSYGVRFKYVF